MHSSVFQTRRISIMPTRPSRLSFCMTSNVCVTQINRTDVLKNDSTLPGEFQGLHELAISWIQTIYAADKKITEEEGCVHGLRQFPAV